MLERGAVGEASRYKAVDGWRVDAAPAVHEALLFTGWDSTQAHATFSARQTIRLEHRDAATGASYDRLETYRARSLERVPIRGRAAASDDCIPALGTRAPW